ncbi:MAG: 2-isopropylmalate synthase [Hahellaceae bacterium]|nr:2-isopropylmalate synthase [Hahellaceae bacterium]MCP5213042.1 2-isopropylmalate synthase [Hahellaceae bacterium]
MSFDHKKYQAFKPIKNPNRRWPDTTINKAPRWCAVDLRDGNQALVNPMSVEQKMRLFELLVAVGFKEIEIGFPAASQADFDFCRKLIDENRIPADVTIQVLTQAREEIIAKTFDALKGVSAAIVHVYNSTSKTQREQVFAMDKSGIKAIAVAGATALQTHAKHYPETNWTFQYSPESFTGTEVEFAVEVINAVIDVWQPQNGQKVIINLPSTVEMSTPNVFADQVEWVLDRINQRKFITACLHTHNDRGCAVASAELGLMAGADRVEGTLMGNGERTGNTDLVTMAMNLYSQGINPNLDMSDMATIVATVEACTEIATHPRHPYAGDLVFTAFSGSHQDAIRKCLQKRQENSLWDVAYLPIEPMDVGRNYEEVVRINSQSGKGGVAYILERDYNITLPRWLQVSFSKVVQAATEKTGGEINSRGIRQLFETEYLSITQDWKLLSYDIHKTSDGVDSTVEFGGDSFSIALKGSAKGAVEATATALSNRLGKKIEVEAYDEFALTAGSAANALACICVVIDDSKYVAAAIAEDTTAATLQALLSAVGKSVALSAVQVA